MFLRERLKDLSKKEGSINGNTILPSALDRQGERGSCAQGCFSIPCPRMQWTRRGITRNLSFWYQHLQVRKATFIRRIHSTYKFRGVGNARWPKGRWQMPGAWATQVDTSKYHMATSKIYLENFLFSHLSLPCLIISKEAVGDWNIFTCPMVLTLLILQSMGTHNSRRRKDKYSFLAVA